MLTQKSLSSQFLIVSIVACGLDTFAVRLKELLAVCAHSQALQKYYVNLAQLPTNFSSSGD